MCIVLWALGIHPVYEWVILSNRDEFYDRPSEPMAIRDLNRLQMLAGKDLKAEGTWLGVGANGRFSVLTNYRDFSIPHRGEKTRGALPITYINHPHTSTAAFLNALTKEAPAYDPFNLLVGEDSEIHYFTRQTLSWQSVPIGIHGLSNAHLNTDWHKVRRGKYLLEQLMSQQPQQPPQPPQQPQASNIHQQAAFALFQSALSILNDTVPAEDVDLPSTGLTLEQERMLSPIFIVSPQYGTRFQTVLLKEYSGHMWIFERYRQGDGVWQEHSFYKATGGHFSPL